MLFLDDSFTSGISVAEVLGDAVMAWLTQLLLGNPLHEFEVGGAEIPRHLCRSVSGETLLLCRAEPVYDSLGKLLGFTLEISDITKRKSAEAAARMREDRLLLALELTPPILWIANAHGDLVQMDRRWQVLTGRSRDESFGRGWVDALHPDDRPQAVFAWDQAVAARSSFKCTYRLACTGPEWRWMLAKAVPRVDRRGEVLDWVGILEDIHEHQQLSEALSMKTDWLKEATQQISLLARQDHLTGLANRRHFDELLNDEVRRALRSREQLALLMVDVDHFKRYNDTYGHLAGDACLSAIGGSLQSMLKRPGDLAARYGGEEFVVLLPNTHAEGAIQVANRALKAICSLALGHTASLTGVVTLSIGVALLKVESTNNIENSSKTLLKEADDALYRAKAEGRNQCVLSQQTSHKRSFDTPISKDPVDLVDG